MSPLELHVGASNGKTRLNIVLPGLAQGAAFGGASSALELVRHLAVHYDSCRFISLFEAGGEPAQFAHLTAYVDSPELAFMAEGTTLACHECDVFLVTYWQGFALWEQLHERRLQQGLPALPFYYLIQDYEPCFSGFGQKHALALKTYSCGSLTRAIINSTELAAYLRRCGIAFSAEYPFKPSLNENIAGFLQERRFRIPPKNAEETIILFYGRPGIDRNCFEAGVETLRLFFETLPADGRKRFTAVSVGLPHRDVPLVPDAVLKSLGRLSIEQYTALLLQAHVGLSLMISPHPSYPPLEMALFGLPTVTTDYSNKKMQGTHPLLYSSAWPEPEALCALLRQAVLTAGKLRGTTQKAVLPSSFSPLGWQENFASLNIEPILP